jgi:hypothetical protein
MMDIQDIINNIAAGENNAAKEGLENALSAKAFDALQGYKQEIAATLYGGQEQESEEDTDHEEDEEEGAYAEGVEQEDGDQLDEVSLDVARKVYKKRAGGVVGTVDTKNSTTAQDKAQQERSKKIINSRFGKKGKAVTHKVDDEHDYYQ